MTVHTCTSGITTSRGGQEGWGMEGKDDEEEEDYEEQEDGEEGEAVE